MTVTTGESGVEHTHSLRYLIISCSTESVSDWVSSTGSFRGLRSLTLSVL